ncbi:hypothetical protein [Paeniglutamicibacter sulfureus]|uniref:Zinc ribbon domain-containing protein n=1 Tax=Paeniglutamicibacter sulfureus TaxID=43666 RepID=A0ABU2BJI5_9MICC|nr:hypothetical protein [Paeniglutamicibacter sulfureus]MDR7358812.1 hypothetical protein [Paeniglutamicibacter sulfureus]
MSRMFFDYRCGDCAADSEFFIPAPAPESQDCPVCSGVARRRYTSRGLGRSGASLAAVAPAAGSIDCRDNADVPGLCHVAPSARRRMVARHRGDLETYEAETKRQTREFETSGPKTVHQVVGHSH